MPVVTRSQQKEEECYKKLNNMFIAKINESLKKNKAAIGKENKMRNLLKTYKLINEMFQFIGDDPDNYIKFLKQLPITIFNKSTELLTERNKGEWEDISDLVLVKEMVDELVKSISNVVPLIR